jgi:hypothetical protein
MPRTNRRTSRIARDQGLRQVNTATKWIAGGAAVLAGFLTFWEAQSVNHAGASGTTPNTVGQPAVSGSDSSGYSDPGYSDPYSNGDLQAPDYAPAPSDRGPVASSGGS